MDTNTIPVIQPFKVSLPGTLERESQIRSVAKINAMLDLNNKLKLDNIEIKDIEFIDFNYKKENEQWLVSGTLKIKTWRKR